MPQQPASTSQQPASAPQQPEPEPRRERMPQDPQKLVPAGQAPVSGLVPPERKGKLPAPPAGPNEGDITKLPIFKSQ